MQGGRTRDLIVLRATLAVACVALTAVIAAPVALAGSPAGDQYGSPLPGVGGGHGNGSPRGSSGSSTPSSGSGARTENRIPGAGGSSSSGPGSGGSAPFRGGG